MTGTGTLLLSWRPAGERAGRVFEWRAVADHNVAARLASDLAATGAARDDEFRLTALDGNGLPTGPAVYTNAAELRIWRGGDEPPAAIPTSAWRTEIAHRGLRRRTAAVVRGALVDAWRGRALQREQVADILGVVEQAFDRTGRASNRLPPV